jgi:hypothetical protein
LKKYNIGPSLVDADDAEQKVDEFVSEKLFGFCLQTNNKKRFSQGADFSYIFFPWKTTFRGKSRGNSWKNDFSELFCCGKFHFFLTFLGGGGIFCEIFPEIFPGKMYEKSAPGDNPSTASSNASAVKIYKRLE